MRIAAAGRIGGNDDGAADAGGDGGIEKMDGARDIDLLKLSDFARMNHAGGVKQNRATGTVAEAGAIVRIADIAGNDLDAVGDARERGGILAGQNQAADS